MTTWRAAEKAGFGTDPAVYRPAPCVLQGERVVPCGKALCKAPGVAEAGNWTLPEEGRQGTPAGWAGRACREPGGAEQGQTLRDEFKKNPQCQKDKGIGGVINADHEAHWMKGGLPRAGGGLPADNGLRLSPGVPATTVVSRRFFFRVDQEGARQGCIVADHRG